MDYVISDTHFGHANIIDYEKRPFNNVQEMDNILIKRWNEVVSVNDTVYHLGDFFLTYTKRQLEIFTQLNGYIILIRGNYDRQSNTKLIDRIGFKEVYPELIYDNALLTHRPVSLEYVVDKDCRMNIHGHQHFNPSQVTPFHYNVSVENINYRPIEISKVIDAVNGV